MEGVGENGKMLMHCVSHMCDGGVKCRNSVVKLYSMERAML